MSYQAITDIIVSPQVKDLQLSGTVKDSPLSASTQSFAEILASMQSNNDSQSKELQNVSEVKTETAYENTKNDTKNEAVYDEPVERGTEQTENRKTENADDKKATEERNEVTENKNAAEEQTEKLQKVSKNVKNERKISKEDFSRLNELVQDENLQNLVQSAKPVNASTQEIKFDPSKKIELADEEMFVSENEAYITLSLPLQQGQRAENEASEFDFSRQNEGKKQMTLDKDGKITVVDLRSEQAKSEAKDLKSELKITQIKQTGDNTATITMDLNKTAQADLLSLNTQTAAADGSNFQAMLHNQLQTSAPEFVKAGNLILKDNNQGTINLILHPDDLGNVKIHMTLDGKTISGQITVATKEALQVFKDNSETLREAFIKSGFENASFDVSLNNGGQFNQNMNFAQQNEANNLVGKMTYASNAAGLDSELEGIFQNAEDVTNYSVNIVA